VDECKEAFTPSFYVLIHTAFRSQADLEHVLSEIAGMRVVLPDRALS